MSQLTTGGSSARVMRACGRAPGTARRRVQAASRASSRLSGARTRGNRNR